MHYRFEHEFAIDAAAYWDMFFSEEYNQGLYSQLKISRQVIEDKRDDKTIRRTVKLTPPGEVPAVFRSVVSDTGYTEHDVYHKDRSSMDVVIEPSMLRNKFDFKAVYSVAPAGPGKCRRVFEGDCKVSVMIIGGQIEKFILDQMKSSYEATAVFTRDYIAKHKAKQA